MTENVNIYDKLLLTVAALDSYHDRLDVPWRLSDGGVVATNGHLLVKVTADTHLVYTDGNDKPDAQKAINTAWPDDKAEWLEVPEWPKCEVCDDDSGRVTKDCKSCVDGEMQCDMGQCIDCGGDLRIEAHCECHRVSLGPDDVDKYYLRMLRHLPGLVYYADEVEHNAACFKFEGGIAVIGKVKKP